MQSSRSRGNPANASVTTLAGAVTVATSQVSAVTTAISSLNTAVTAGALHRSPNAVVGMRIYDTTKDSDGGAWVDKCAHTSWMNETLTPGAWIYSSQPNFMGIGASSTNAEMTARAMGGTLGNELLSNGSFTNGVTGWAGLGGGSIVANASGGADVITVGNNGASTSFVSEIGASYLVTGRVTSANNGRIYINDANSSSGTEANVNPLVGSFAFLITAVGATTYVILGSHTAGQTITFDDLSVKKVVSWAPSGSYFQSVIDGKFYRLFKNRFSYWNDITNGVWSRTAISSVTANADGVGDLVIPNTTNSSHLIAQAVNTLGHPCGTFTVRAKAGGYNFIVLNVGNTGNVWFNVSTGVVGTNASGLAASIVPAADAPGYFDCSINSTATALATTNNIFIKDSDGGSTAWTPDGINGVYIAQAQHEFGPFTGWEAKTGPELGVVEIFRGNKAKFPRIAGVVAEAASLTIYDLAESGRPMWMRFVQGGTAGTPGTTNLIGPTITPVTGVTALNGIICFSSTGGGPAFVDFPVDERRNYGTLGLFRYNGNIAQRQSGLGQSQITTTPVMPTNNSTAVAMCVQPDAPITPSTGLQIPTTAWATPSGITVIRHDGGLATANNIASVNVWFDGRRNAVTAGENNRNYRKTLAPSYTSFVASSASVFPVAAGVAIDSTLARGYGDMSYMVRSGGRALVLYRANDASGGYSPVFAEIGSAYNTGWMAGDIRRCWMADTVAGATESNLVSNADNEAALMAFGTPSANGGTFERVANPSGGGYAASLTSNSSSSGTHQVSFGSAALIPAGKAVEVSGRFYVPTGGIANFKIFDNSDGSWFGVNSTVKDGWVSFSVTRPAKASQWSIGVGNNSAETVTSGSACWYLDDLVVKEAVADRTYKNKPATIYGTLARTAVAAAAQLVVYSGFSAANYLQEPYSADLDFGVGAWTCSAWVNIPIALQTAHVANFPVVSANLVSLDGFTVFNSTLNGTGGSRIATRTSATGNYGMQHATTVSAHRSYKTSVTWSANNALASLFVEVGARTFSLGTAVSGSATILLTPSSGSAPLYFYVAGNGTIGDSIQLDAVSFEEVGPCIVTERTHSSGSTITLGVTGFGLFTATAYDGTTTRTATTTAGPYNTATFIHASATYDGAGRLAILVNGREVVSTLGTPLLTMNNASAVTTIGNSRALDAPFPGSLALVKWAVTIPTLEAAQWMYDQEKRMFNPGAQITLPGTTSLLDISYDDLTDTVTTIDAGNETNFRGLIRTSTSVVPAGAFTKVARGSGIELISRSTTNIGVDVTIPATNVRDDLERADETARRARFGQVFSYVGGFTANVTINSNSLTSVANLTVPSTVNLRGATVTGTGIPASTVITDVVGATVYLSKVATATNNGVNITFKDFPLPVGYEAQKVNSDGVNKREGSGKDWTRSFDGFVEKEIYATEPGVTAWVQIEARAQQSS